MKRIFSWMGTSRKGLTGAIVAAAILLHASAVTCQAAAFSSPVGTWDLISSGAGQNGIAFLTFLDDGTFGGYHFWSPTLPKKPATNPRNSGNSGRDDSPTSSAGKTNNFVFGFDSIGGNWNFDRKGRVIGFFVVLLNVSSTSFGAGTIQTNINPGILGTYPTNITVNFDSGIGSVITNIAWPTYTNSYTIFNTNIVVTLAEKTNAVNFVGTVAPGKRMSLVASTLFGKTTYKGLPFVPVVDISGAWIGSKKTGGQTFYEFFNLIPGDYPNLYTSENEIGPGYGFSTVAMVSRQKKIGFTTVEFTGTNTTLRATAGPISLKRKVSAATKGVLEPNKNVSFKAFLQSAP